MVTTLYLVRHGATEGDGVARYKGSIDVPLSALGKEQIAATAERLREHLANLAAARRHDYLRDVHGSGAAPAADQQPGGDATPGPAAIYCSPLDRARESARIIAAPYGLTPIAEAGLRERHFGVWEGLSFTEIRAAWPEHFEAWAADPVGFAPPDGENTLAVARRGRAAIHKILAAHPGREIIVVAHGGINRLILCHFMQLPLKHLFRIEQSLACFNLIELWDRYPVIKLLNG
ncbi:MAG: histidine phosphatase family protein [Desulfurivibrio sp.]|nr:histidine phosphatase family protein [Desulfurivibrio sp.]